MAGNDDDSDQEPDVEREKKLKPCFVIGSEAIVETNFNSQVQINPSYERAKECAK